MFYRRHAAVVIAVCVTTSGCLARQIASDGIDVRLALAEMYMDQAIDNLIRARERQPFVQLAYSQLSVNDKDIVTASTGTGGGADSLQSNAFDSSKAALIRLTRTVQFNGRFPFLATAQRDRTLSFHADPVIDNNAVYEAYLEFADNPRLFMVGEQEPSFPVHIARKRGCHWYWVPCPAGEDFLQLVLKTSVLPSQGAAIVFWPSVISTIGPRFGNDGAKVADKHVITLTQEVPNDDGIVLLTTKGRKKVWLIVQQLSIEPFAENAPDDPMMVSPQMAVPGPSPGKPTKQLYTGRIDNVPIEDLKGATVQFFAENFQNPSTKVQSDSQKVQDAIENLRLLLNKASITNP